MPDPPFADAKLLFRKPHFAKLPATEESNESVVSDLVAFIKHYFEVKRGNILLAIFTEDISPQSQARSMIPTQNHIAALQANCW